MMKMIMKLVMLLRLFQMLVMPTSASLIQKPRIVDPSRITLSELQLLHSDGKNGESTINLPRLLHGSRGVLRVSIDDGYDNGIDDTTVPPFRHLRKKALKSLCECPTFSQADPFRETLRSHPKDLQEILLPDGSVRRTLATATVSFDYGGDVLNARKRKEAQPFPLPDFVETSCGKDAYDALEDLRDVVAGVVDAFVGKLDLDTNGSRKQGKMTYREILSTANHLEHFHIYTKEDDDQEADRFLRNDGKTESTIRQYDSTENDPKNQDEAIGSDPLPTLDYHTDAGFFLAFVPAMDCHTHSTDDSSFYLKQQDDSSKSPMKFQEDEVVILIGAAAQYWFPADNDDSSGTATANEDYPFIAASHALRLLPNTHRAWYGKMHMLPSSWTVSKNNRTDKRVTLVKYGDVLPTLRIEHNQAPVPSSPVDGCGTTMFNSQKSLEKLISSKNYLLPPHRRRRYQQRRRIQHVDDPTYCNNETNFFCWYQCLDIPNSDHTMDYLQDGYSLYCLDPAILVSTDNSIMDATDPCEDGYTHNSNCMGSWQLTDENVEGYNFPYFDLSSIEETDSANGYHIDLGEQYCYGGTSMYMDGFHWIGTTCVIYLFPAWVLSTPAKFVWASIGSILSAILLEFILWKRRSVYAMPAGYRRLFCSAFAYGVQLAMGYFIMLVIMTYSGPLFVSTVAGMMIGHVLFNAQDSLVKKMEKKQDKVETEMKAAVGNEDSSGFQNETIKICPKAGSDDDEEMECCCCENDQEEKLEEETPGAVKVGSKVNKDRIPEGATPCCQYTL
ncbi:hypothetical protein ACHAXS_013304 [Conticribra weissflogii]